MRSVVEAGIGDRVARLVQTEPKGEGQIAGTRLGLLFRNFPQMGASGSMLPSLSRTFRRSSSSQKPSTSPVGARTTEKTLRLVVEPVADNLGVLHSHRLPRH